MDSSAAPILLLAPIVIVVAAYLLAWRGKSPSIRKAGNWVLAGCVGAVALFASWWALGTTIGIWGLDGSLDGSLGPHTFGEMLAALALEIIVCVFPFGLWYLFVRFAKIASRRGQPT